MNFRSWPEITGLDKPDFRQVILTITSKFIIIFIKLDRKGKSVERRGRKATGLKLKSYDSRAAKVTYSSLWELLPKGFFCFRILSPYCLIIKICLEGSDKNGANI
jgi:hypothetical protein